MYDLSLVISAILFIFIDVRIYLTIMAEQQQHERPFRNNFDSNHFLVAITKVETILSSLINEIKDFRNSVQESIKDHEGRLRSLEKNQWRIFGIYAVIAIFYEVIKYFLEKK
jgi:hypothetical protein